ncbi:hypothetical protein MUK42_24546 [Musa troglodytarum]|uniref:Uncharacterized protein n=1 Tax=Musa troglodytarum TaxID=320322 RepID=A0A9E7GF70_9LILI|nr:hypothetical protein MUK42_24546 [Musa troglodytarum]
MAIIALERKSSIEAEPRTLTVGELQLAREAAMFILNNDLMGEASKIFTEVRNPMDGLKPLPSIRDYDLFEDCDDEYEEEEEEEEGGDEMTDWAELEQSYHTCLQIDVANASF